MPSHTLIEMTAQEESALEQGNPIWLWRGGWLAGQRAKPASGATTINDNGHVR